MTSVIMVSGLILSNINGMEQPNTSLAHRAPDEAFVEMADKMKFKDLRSFASTDKASRAKVKGYFNYRKNLIRNIVCPVLTKQWILAHDRQSLEQGSIGTTPAQRENPKTHPIVELNGQKWGVAGLNAKDFSEDPENAQYGTEKSRGVFFDIEKPDGDGGPRVTKTCFYNGTGPKKTGSILLYLEEEYLILE